jgi:hypothetical protein
MRFAYCFLVLTACSATRPQAAERESIVFAPDIISVGNVYRGSFTPDGSEFYFFKKVTDDPRREDYRIFVSRNTAAGWTHPDTVRLGDSPSDLYPAVDPTGKYLVFSSYRGAPGDTSARPSASLWVSERSGKGWSAPRLASAASGLGAYHAQLIFDGGGRLHFIRHSSDYRSKLGEFHTRITSDGLLASPTPSAEYAAMQRLAGDLHLWETGPGWDTTYHLVVASQRDSTGRPAAADLYVSLRQNGSWSALRLLPGVSTPGTENFPFFGPGGHRLYFVRDFREFRSIDLRGTLSDLRKTLR